MSGILTRRYKPGSIVYFEGDKSENIYILKSGRVMLSYLKPETGEEIKEEIRPGEFFGVKAAIGKYPREETAQTLTETSVLVLTLADFERLVLNNIQVVKKMLRVFSNQLRRIGRAAREVLGESNTVNPEVELYKIGEYYYKAGKPEQALYTYKRYMNYYPDTKYSSSAMERIREIESGSYGAADLTMVDDGLSTTGMDDFSMDSGDTAFDNNLMDDFSFSEEPSEDLTSSQSSFSMDSLDFDENSPTTAGHTELSSEMDSFVEDDSMSGMDFSFDMGDELSEATGPAIDEKIANATKMDSKGDHEGAIAEFNEIVNSAEFSSADSSLIEQTYFGLGKAYMNGNKSKESLQAFSRLIKNHPESELIKNALLYIGFIYEKSGDMQKAKSYYRKVATTAPKDKVSTDAATRLSRLGQG